MTDMLDTRHIETIEDLPFSAVDRWCVLLVATGHKRGAWIHLASDIWRAGDAGCAVSEEQVKRVSQALQSLGLHFQMRRRVTNAGLWQPSEDESGRQRLNQLVDVLIARNDGDVRSLLEAVEGDLDHHALGMLLGYPATSVEAFLNNRRLSKRDIVVPSELEDAQAHTYFMLSHDHWREELSVVRQWLEVLDVHSRILRLELDRHARRQGNLTAKS